MSERFYVATTTGFLAPDHSGKRREPGVSAMVLDRAYGHRAVFQTRTEDLGAMLAGRRLGEVVRRAEQVASDLNAGRDLRESAQSVIPHGTVAHVEMFGCTCWRCEKVRRRRA